MARQWTNNASSTLASALNTTATTLSVATGEGSLFPAASSGDTFALTLQDASSNIEIVLCTAHTAGADSFTIIRAQESTSARSWSIGDVVELRITAAAIEDFATKTGTETLTNKTLSSPSITGTLTLGGAAVTATAAELNQLDGVTLSNYADRTADAAWTGSQRATLVTDNDGSFDMDAGQNFSCTPTANFTLTFTNIANGQSGWILLVNTGGYTVSLHANSKADANFTTTVSTAGTYLISYFSNGTNAYLTNSAAMA